MKDEANIAPDTPNQEVSDKGDGSTARELGLVVLLGNNTNGMYHLRLGLH